MSLRPTVPEGKRIGWCRRFTTAVLHVLSGKAWRRGTVALIAIFVCMQFWLHLAHINSPRLRGYLPDVLTVPPPPPKGRPKRHLQQTFDFLDLTHKMVPFDEPRSVKGHNISKRSWQAPLFVDLNGRREQHTQRWLQRHTRASTHPHDVYWLGLACLAADQVMATWTTSM